MSNKELEELQKLVDEIKTNNDCEWVEINFPLPELKFSKLELDGRNLWIVPIPNDKPIKIIKEA